MTLHERFGWHIANLKISHWDEGYFVTSCTICGKEMVKLPGLPWRLRGKPG
jgi:hypothetical protein